MANDAANPAPVFTPRTVALVERATSSIVSRFAEPVRSLGARTLGFIDRLIGARLFGATTPRMIPSSSASAGGEFLFAQPWYESARAPRASIASRDRIAAPSSPVFADDGSAAPQIPATVALESGGAPPVSARAARAPALEPLIAQGPAPTPRAAIEPAALPSPTGSPPNLVSSPSPTTTTEAFPTVAAPVHHTTASSALTPEAHDAAPRSAAAGSAGEKAQVDAIASALRSAQAAIVAAAAPAPISSAQGSSAPAAASLPATPAAARPHVAVPVVPPGSTIAAAPAAILSGEGAQAGTSGAARPSAALDRGEHIDRGAMESAASTSARSPASVVEGGEVDGGRASVTNDVSELTAMQIVGRAASLDSARPAGLPASLAWRVERLAASPSTTTALSRVFARAAWVDRHLAPAGAVAEASPMVDGPSASSFSNIAARGVPGELVALDSPRVAASTGARTVRRDAEPLASPSETVFSTPTPVVAQSAIEVGRSSAGEAAQPILSTSDSSATTKVAIDAPSAAAVATLSGGGEAHAADSSPFQASRAEEHPTAARSEASRVAATLENGLTGRAESPLAPVSTVAAVPPSQGRLAERAATSPTASAMAPVAAPAKVVAGDTRGPLAEWSSGMPDVSAVAALAPARQVGDPILKFLERLVGVQAARDGKMLPIDTGRPRASSPIGEFVTAVETRREARPNLRTVAAPANVPSNTRSIDSPREAIAPRGFAPAFVSPEAAAPSVSRGSAGRDAFTESRVGQLTPTEIRAPGGDAVSLARGLEASGLAASASGMAPASITTGKASERELPSTALRAVPSPMGSPEYTREVPRAAESVATAIAQHSMLRPGGIGARSEQLAGSIGIRAAGVSIDFIELDRLPGVLAQRGFGDLFFFGPSPTGTMSAEALSSAGMGGRSFAGQPLVVPQLPARSQAAESRRVVEGSGSWGTAASGESAPPVSSSSPTMPVATSPVTTSSPAIPSSSSPRIATLEVAAASQESTATSQGGSSVHERSGAGGFMAAPVRALDAEVARRFEAVWSLLRVFPASAKSALDAAAAEGAAYRGFAMPLLAAAEAARVSAGSAPTRAPSRGQAGSTTSVAASPVVSSRTVGAPSTFVTPAAGSPAAGSMLGPVERASLPNGRMPRGGYLWPRSEAFSTHVGEWSPPATVAAANAGADAAAMGQPAWGGMLPIGTPAVHEAFGDYPADRPLVASRGATGAHSTASGSLARPMTAPRSSRPELSAATAMLGGQLSAPLMHLVSASTTSSSAGTASAGGASAARVPPQFSLVEGARVGSAPSSESSARMIDALRSQQQNAPSDDRVTLADLTLVATASSTSQMAASAAGGHSSHSHHATHGHGGESKHGGGEKKSPEAERLEIEIMAQHLVDEVRRRAEVSRERTGDSWES